MLKLLLCSFCFLYCSLCFLYLSLSLSLYLSCLWKEKEVKSDDEKDIMLKQSVMIITVSLYVECSDNHGFGKTMLDVCR